MRRFRLLVFAGLPALCAMALAGGAMMEQVLHPFDRALVPPLRALVAGAEDVRITAADGAVLRGWFVRASPASGRAVLLLHGQADTRAGALGYARLFLARGYDVLAPDSRAHGESGGALATYGLKEAADVCRWADWLRSERAEKRVFALGESMGAAILIQALAAGAQIDAAVAESSFSSLREVAYYRVGAICGGGELLGRTALRPIVEVGLTYARIRYGLNLDERSPAAAIASVRVPVLLIHGAADLSIPPSHSQRILAAARARAELWTPAETGHIGAYPRWPAEFERRVTAWFHSAP